MLVPLDKLGTRGSDMTLLQSLPLKCAACGGREVELFLFVKTRRGRGVGRGLGARHAVVVLYGPRRGAKPGYLAVLGAPLSGRWEPLCGTIGVGHGDKGLIPRDRGAASYGKDGYQRQKAASHMLQ